MTSSLVPHFATCVLVTLILGAGEVSGQKVFGLPASAMHDHTACEALGCDGLVGIAEDHFQFTPPPTTFRSSSATIQITYNNFPATAEAAFQYAANIWAGQISSPVTIEVNATWANLGDNILGSASPSTIHRNFMGAAALDVYYPQALANQLSSSDLESSSADITCNFGSEVNWYFGLDGNVPPGAYDFVTVVLHELCHGLGMIGSAMVAGNTGFLGQSGSPFVYDTFINDNNSSGSILDLNNGTSNLADALTGGGLVWSGPEGLAAAAVPPGIYAPDPWEPGASFSHLREDMYLSGNANALMTPNLNTGEAIHNPGPIVMGMFSDMGWGIEGCSVSALLAGVQSPCNQETNTYSQQIILIYDDAPTGLLNINGSLFTVTGSPQIVSLNNLPANGAPVDVTVYFTGDPSCSATQTALFTAPESCANGTCSLVSYTIGPQSNCNPIDGTYTQELTLQFDYTAGLGDVDINGQSFPVINDVANVILTGLLADGQSVNLAITFTSEDACGFAVIDAWTAPLPCPCSIAIALGAVGECDPSTGNHTVDFTVSLNNPPGSGLLSVGGALFNPPESSGTYSATVEGFPADGQNATAGAFFTDLPSCSTAQDATWVAPEPCSCPGDIDGDGIIGVSDTLDLLANFGCVGVNCTGDVDGDNIVGVADILQLLSVFGSNC